MGFGRRDAVVVRRGARRKKSGFAFLVDQGAGFPSLCQSGRGTDGKQAKKPNRNIFRGVGVRPRTWKSIDFKGVDIVAEKVSDQSSFDSEPNVAEKGDSTRFEQNSLFPN